MEVPKALDAAKLREGLNFYVGPSIAVVSVEEVPLDFHARFSAVGRRYEYIIMNRRAHSALWYKRAWHVMKPLDADVMHQAAQHFVGRHDFSAFRAAACQGGSAIKNLSFFNVWREGELIKAEVSAPSFLHNQVRIMMGTLKMVGEGTWAGSHIPSLLQGGDRTHAGPTAPPYGLYFKGAYYTTEGEV
jgi:tRNA pseudouridine38-40 synthase